MMDDFKPARPRVSAEPDPPVFETNIEADEPTFRPPDEVALEEPERAEPEPKPEVPMPKKKRRFRLPKWSRKQWLIFGVLALLFLALLGFGLYKAFFEPEPKPVPKPVVKKKVEPPKPTTVASPLTGVQVAPELAKLPVTAIMIENSPDARPQAGLIDAGVVFEAVAEGGITRFLTLFQEAQPDYIGPVRSVRPYYIDWAVPFDAPIAHVGGSAEALAQIRAGGIKDLDYSFNSGAYRRVSNRYAPHNVYTSRANLLSLHTAKGYTTSKFIGYARKEDKKLPTPTARAIDFAISSALYNSHYDYDGACNCYLRSNGGKPHLDERSAKQISAKVVIAMIMPKGIHADRVHSVYGTHGSGKAFIFQDGGLTVGIWEKKDRSSEIRFGDANGSPLGINRGNTWITALGTEGSVGYRP